MGLKEILEIPRLRVSDPPNRWEISDVVSRIVGIGHDFPIDKNLERAFTYFLCWLLIARGGLNDDDRKIVEREINEIRISLLREK
jgi:hypothetical protein